MGGATCSGPNNQSCTPSEICICDLTGGNWIPPQPYRPERERPCLGENDGCEGEAYDDPGSPGTFSA